MYTRSSSRGGHATEYTVKLDQVPRWSEQDQRPGHSGGGSAPSSPDHSFSDPLSSLATDNGKSGFGFTKFKVDHEINSKLYLWRGAPWALEVDAVVNSTNEVSPKMFLATCSL